MCFCVLYVIDCVMSYGLFVFVCLFVYSCVSVYGLIKFVCVLWDVIWYVFVCVLCLGVLCV